MTQERNTVDETGYGRPPACRLGEPSEGMRIRMGIALLAEQDANKVARTFRCTAQQVSDAWEYCRHRLSQHFAITEGRDRYLMDDRELAARFDAAIACLEERLDDGETEQSTELMNS